MKIKYYYRLNTIIVYKTNIKITQIKILIEHF